MQNTNVKSTNINEKIKELIDISIKKKKNHIKIKYKIESEEKPIKIFGRYFVY